MAFSFGTPAASTAPAAASPFAGFGTPASASTSTPSLFGAAPASSAPSLFGSTPAPAGGLFGTSQPQQPATSTGGLFGASTAAPSTGGLFGSTQPTSSAPSLFGGATSQATTTPSLFGASAPPATSSLFGSTASQTPATGGPFGQPAASTSTAPSLFGAPANTGTSSLFGGAAGATSQPAASTSLFGGGGSSLFGQQPQAQQPAVTAAPLFGQSQSAASASLFGSKPASSSLFGSSTFGTSTNAGAMVANPGLTPQQQQAQQQQLAAIPKLGDPPAPSPNEPSIEARMQAIKSAWDVNDPACRFQTYFYNEVKEPNKVSMYGRPPNGTNEQAWRKAVRENPDPERLVPAIAIGFPAVQARLESQSRQSTAHQNLLSEIHAHLDQLSSTHALTTSLRTLRAQQTAQALTSRLLGLVAKLGPLSTNRNASIRREEDALRIGLDKMTGEVKNLRTRGNELWSGVGALKAHHASQVHAGTTANGNSAEWAIVDDQGLKQVLDILSSQQAGLDHLTKTIQAADDDVDVIKEAFGLASSSSTLASSKSTSASLAKSTSSSR